MTANVRGLMNALRQAINEAILDSSDVAVAIAALKRTGECPVFAIDVVLQEAPGGEEAPGGAEPRTAEHVKETRPTGELVLSNSDQELLKAFGIAYSQ